MLINCLSQRTGWRPPRLSGPIKSLTPRPSALTTRWRMCQLVCCLIKHSRSEPAPSAQAIFKHAAMQTVYCFKGCLPAPLCAHINSGHCSCVYSRAHCPMLSGEEIACTYAVGKNTWGAWKTSSASGSWKGKIPWIGVSVKGDTFFRTESYKITIGDSKSR